jgi:hypothetical protein
MISLDCDVSEDIERRSGCGNTNQGPMLWFLKYFRRKIWRDLKFFPQTNASFEIKIDDNIVFLRKTPIFSPKIGKKWQKICEYNIDPSKLQSGVTGDKLRSSVTNFFSEKRPKYFPNHPILSPSWKNWYLEHLFLC